MRAGYSKSVRPNMQKHIGSLFGDHVDSGNDEMAWNAGKNRCVDDAEIPYTMDAELAIDHTALIFRFHGAGATGMMAPGVIFNMSFQLIVGIKMPTRNLLFCDQTANGIHYLSPKSDTGDNRIEIFGHSAVAFTEIIKVDLGAIRSIRGSQSHSVPP